MNKNFAIKDIQLMNPPKSERIKTFENLLRAPSFVSDEQANKVWTDLQAPNDTEEHAKAIDFLNDAIAIPFDFMQGKLNKNGIWNKYFMPLDVQKSSEGSLLTHTGQSITLLSVYDTDINLLTFDQEWRAAFQFHTIVDNSGKIVDVFDLTRWELLLDDEEIKFFPFKEDAATYLRPLRYGGGCSFARDDMERNPMVTLNAAIASCRFRSAELQKDNAYTLMNAAWTTAFGAGQTTALHALGLPQTLNLARNANISRNDGKDWGVNFMTPVHVFAHPDHYGPIEAAFATWSPRQAVDLTTPDPDNAIRTVGGTIIRHYSFNLTADLDNVRGGNAPAAGLVLPGFKNKWGTYNSLEFYTGQNWKKRRVEVGGDERRNAQTDTDQFDVIELS